MHFYTIFATFHLSINSFCGLSFKENPIQKNNFTVIGNCTYLHISLKFVVFVDDTVGITVLEKFLHSGKGSQRLLFYYLLGLNNDKLYRHVLMHMSTCISNTNSFSLPSTVTHSPYRSNLSLALHFIFYPLTPNPCTPYNLQWWCSCFSTIYNKFEQLRHVRSFRVAVCIIWHYSITFELIKC